MSDSFSPSYDEHVYSKVLERIPALSKASISYSVSGLYEMTPDAVPIVSGIKIFKGLYCCAGFAGHGFMHSPAIGKLMSEVLVGRKAHLDISDLDNDRFERPTSKEQLII
jgi:sarcosine oxidase subunit beta